MEKHRFIDEIPMKIVIFHSYVGLTEGTKTYLGCFESRTGGTLQHLVRFTDMWWALGTICWRKYVFFQESYDILGYTNPFSACTFQTIPKVDLMLTCQKSTRRWCDETICRLYNPAIIAQATASLMGHKQKYLCFPNIGHLVGGFNHLETYEFVNGNHYPNIWNGT